MAFMGTIIVNGRGWGVVVETGARTVLGQIARDVKELSVTETPLQRKMVKFAQFIGSLCWKRVRPLFGHSEVITAVAASVATIPEGSPSW